MLWASCVGHGGQANAQDPTTPTPKAPHPLPSAQSVPLDALAPALRATVRRVLEQPTLVSRGPVEVFRGRPVVYDWLLDHPDRAVRMWRRLGVKCMDITDQGGGRFGWTDGKGSAVHWDTIASSSSLRVWYAEGAVRPDALLPTVPMRAVVVLRYAETLDAAGRVLLRHQADLFLQTDSKLATLVARMLGPSAPRLAEQGIGQLEMFFSALVWYLDQHPERTEALLLGSLTSDTPAPRQ